MSERTCPLRCARLFVALALAAGCHGPKGDPSTASEATSGGPEPTSAGSGPTSAGSEPTSTTGEACATVIEGDLRIDDGTDVAGLACVVEVRGELRLEDTTGWSDMTALSALRAVGGDLRIVGNAALVSLDGLQALERIGGWLSVGDNPQLVSLDGLQALARIGGYVGLRNNTKLGDLSGLSGVRQLGGLYLQGNGLTSVAGLQGEVAFSPALAGHASVLLVEETLTGLDGFAALSVSAPQGLRITLRTMPALTDASGLEVFAAAAGPIEVELWDLPALPRFAWPGRLAALKVLDTPALQELELPAVTSAREITVEDAPALTSLAGLSALRSVSDWLSLGWCRGSGGLGGIVDLHGLEALEQVELLQIDGNASLTSLTGLSVDLQAEHVFIRDNPMLPQAEAEAWLAAASHVGKSYSEACENQGGPECVVGCPPQGE
ncbi:hypothetical protein [Nannocystis punicea]|uniref:Receptor L domain-containing protein n=1 Tax=Nannocystis punicea TaxID=2995304 RepID=A0ABY7GTG4_9BACT|nr:hypothetical protein [Nannocystis poenicansa]WAS90254.1 hypothetical protein O0S08_29020 [Nannocystis poenicansa]